MESVASYEVIRAERAAPHDQILVATSGHSAAAPDCPVEVTRVATAGRPVLWIRLRDGRTSVFVPARTVYRMTETEL